MKKISAWLLAVPTLLIGGCYVTNLILFPNTGPHNIRITKETTYLLGPLDQEGFVDYVEALNLQTSQGVTPENNAVVLLLKALGPKDIDAACRVEVFRRLGMKPVPEKGDYFIDLRRFVTDHLELMPSVEEPADAAEAENPLTPETVLDEQEEESQRRPWSREEFPAVAAWLEANDGPLALASKASLRSQFYWPAINNDPQGTLLTVGLGPIWTLKEVSRSLVSRAMLALNEGRADEAWLDLLTVHRLSRLLGKQDNVILALLSHTLCGIAHYGTTVLAENVAVDRKQGEQMIANLRQLTPLPSAKEYIGSGDRIQILNAVIAAARTGDFTSLESSIGTKASPRPVNTVDWNMVLEYFNDVMDRVVAVERHRSFEKRREAFDQIIDRINREREEANSILGRAQNVANIRSRSLSIGSILAKLLVPAYSACFASGARAQMQLELSILAIALAAYKHDHGEYPDALAKLVPDYLDEIPLDLFTDKDLRYEKTADGYLLYSLGPNVKDDGGATADDDSTDYDIVVRVPSKRGQNGD